MKFEPVDFKVYDKPPYYPQYLSRGETKKLVSFDSDQFAELDRLVDKTSDQYDLDRAKAVLLDRLGKLVNESREGNDDELYRLLIRLRVLLNTTNGSINDIIKVIKFIFSSETVHIQQNYPAGITILHDGENPSINFNKYISQVVAAGVSYDTRELFNYIEHMPATDLETKKIEKSDAEMFTDTVFRNGRVLRDGTTVFDTEEAELYRNGAVCRDGSVERNGWYRRPAAGRIRTPIYRRSGIWDELALVFGDSVSEVWESVINRNGSFIRDGTLTRNGKAPVSMNDALDFDTIGAWYSDSFPLEDSQEKTVSRQDTDTIGHGYLRNGKHARDGSIYRAPDGVIDVLVMHTEEPPMTDTARACITRTGFAPRDGTFDRSGFAEEGILDDFVAGKRFNYRRDGRYTRDGSIYRNGDTFIPLG